VIRQAISCDICGEEKKQTNHWFVVCEQAGEVRVSAFNSRTRLRTGDKHLCGATCMHKLLDDYMVRAIGGKTGSMEMVGMTEENLMLESRIESRSGSASSELSDNYLVRERLYDPRRFDGRFSDTSLTGVSTGEIYPSDDESSARLISATAMGSSERGSTDIGATALRATVPSKAKASPARISAELVRMPAKATPQTELDEKVELQPEVPRRKSREWRAEAWERERERELRAASRMRSNG